MQYSRSKSLNLASRFTFLAMQSSHIKSLATLAILCLLPLGLKAQTTPTITVDGTATSGRNEDNTAKTLADGESITVTAAGSIALTTGVAVTGAGNNTIINSGTISSDDDIAIEITADGFTLTNNAGATIEGNEDAIRTQGDVEIVNAGTITAATNGTYRAIYLQGTADADTITANPTAPVYDATGTDLAGKWSGYDAYYFNAKITNEATGIIEATGLITAIDTETERVQIINHGTIEITIAGVRFNGGGAISFAGGANQGFVYNTGIIRSFNGAAISTANGLLNGVHTPANATTEIVIHNDGGTIESGGTAIRIGSLILIVNSGTIDGENTIVATGVASATTLAAQATRPAYNATGTDLDGKWSGYDAYYFNAKILNEATGIIRSIAADGSTAINLQTKRTQIINHGAITGRAPGPVPGSGSASTILFDANNGALLGLQEGSQNFLYNTGTISSLGTDATIRASYATPRNFAAAEANEITIHNDGGTIEAAASIAIELRSLNLIVNSGTIEAAASIAIELRSLNLIVNSGAITGGTDSHGIHLAGAPSETTIALNPTAPAWDADKATRDAYYFNNTIINEGGGTITGKGTGHGIAVAGKRTQIINYGTIEAEGTGNGIFFDNGSGESIVVNTGNITSVGGWGIAATGSANNIVVINGGTISGGLGAIRLSNGNDILVIRAGSNIVGAVDFFGGADELIYASADGVLTNTITGLPSDGTRTISSDSDLGGPFLISISGSQTTAQNLRLGHHLTVTAAGSIEVAAGTAVTGAGDNEINNAGTISSDDSTAIVLQSLNLIVNTGAITGGTDSHGIDLQGAADADTLAAQATAPAFNSTQELRDAYYFNNKVINQVEGTSTGTITGTGTDGHGINIAGARAQIINFGGRIVAAGTGHGIYFTTGSGQSFVQNTGTIEAASGNAIHADPGVNEIVIHNTGTMESTSAAAILLRSLNLLVNSGDITGGTDSHGIDVAGGANPATIREGPAAAPAWDAEAAGTGGRDPYYFNNIVINEVGGTITGKGTGHGIHVANKRTQIFNHGTIVAEGTGHGIYFAAASGESIVVNTGTIEARGTAGWGIYVADAANSDTPGSIVIINGGSITGGAGAIRLSPADDILVIRSGSNITGDINFEGGTGDQLIYASADGTLTNTITGLRADGTSTISSDSPLGAVAPESTLILDPDTTPDPTDPTDPTDPNGGSGGDGSGGGPSDGSGGGGGSASPLGNHQSLFALSDELILDLNAGIQDAIYEHRFSLNSETSSRRNSSRTAPRKASEKPSWWTQGFGSFRAQDESDNNAKASHTLGGVLVGYDLTPEQVGNLGLKDLSLPFEIKNLGFFLGVALGSLSTDDDAELITQNFFGGVNFQLTKDEFFYGFNFALGITYYNSERSVKESGETVNIEGKYSGFFLSPEFIIGMKTQVKFGNTAPKADSFWERMKNQVNGMDIIPSFRIRYSLALLGEYTEDSDAESRISAEKRNTGTIESRAQVALPLQLANQAWKLEPRLGLEYRIDLNKSDFDVEALATETPIDYDAEKESTLGFFGGLSVAYLKANTTFKLNADIILSGESLILRGQAGFGFAF